MYCWIMMWHRKRLRISDESPVAIPIFWSQPTWPRVVWYILRRHARLHHDLPDDCEDYVHCIGRTSVAQVQAVTPLALRVKNMR